MKQKWHAIEYAILGLYDR